MTQKEFSILLPDARLGGAQRVLLRLAAEFVAQGHRVDLILLVADGALLDQVPKTVRCVQLLGPGSNWFVLASVGLIKLWKYLKTERPICVLSSGTGTNLLLIAATRLVKPRPRVVLREAVSTLNRPAILLRGLMSRFFRHADACIGVSRGVADELRRLGVADTRVHSIPNPVDSEALQAQVQRASVFRPDDAPPYLVSVGRLVQQKDHVTLIRAFARVSGKIPHQLIIVGEGPCRPELEELIKASHLQDRVLLQGQVANPQRLVREAQAFVLSSSWEGYPNALLEALAHGVRTISTDCPHGPAEILEQGRYGILVPVGDDAAMADAILAALQAPSLATGWLAAQPRPEEIARRYLAVMQDD